MKIIFSLLVLSIYSNAYCQYEWRSRQSGLWTDSSTWKYFTGTSWRDTTGIPPSDASVLIDSAHSVTLDADTKIRNLTLHSQSPAGKLILQAEKKLTLSGQLSSTASAPPSTIITPGNGSLIFTGEDSTQLFSNSWGSSPSLPHLVIRLQDSTKTATTAPTQNIKTNFFELACGNFSVDGDLRIDGGADSTTGKLIIAEDCTLRINGKLKRSTSNSSSFDSLSIAGTLTMNSSSGIINARHIYVSSHGSILTNSTAGLTGIPSTILSLQKGSVIGFTSVLPQIISPFSYSTLRASGGIKSCSGCSADVLSLGTRIITDTLLVRTKLMENGGYIDGALERTLFSEPFARFPLGRRTVARTITIFKFGGSSSRATASVDSVIHLSQNPAASKQSIYYYSISPTDGTLAAKIFLSYSLSDFPAGTIRSHIYPFVYTDNTWHKLPAAVSDSLVTIDSLTSFGPIVLSATNDGLLSVNEIIPHRQDVEVFPNPFSTSFTIRTSFHQPFLLFDLQGKVVDTIEPNTMYLPSRLSSGIYFLQLPITSFFLPIIHRR